MRYLTGLLAILALLLCAAVAGLYATAAGAPGTLHEVMERWLADATHAPAQAATLRLAPSFPPRLEGSGLVLFDGALTVERASARIDWLSLLIARPRLSRLRLDGAHLQITRSPEGVWSPPIFGKRRKEPDPEPALAPLRAIEAATRSLLSGPLLADTLIVRRSRVSLVHPSPASGADPVRLEFLSASGRLLHSRLFDDARLFLRVRLATADRDRGLLEWRGSRSPGGGMQAQMAATGLDLSALEPYVDGVLPMERLGGTLDGVAEFAIRESGAGRLDLDLAMRDLVASVSVAPVPVYGPAERPRDPPPPLRLPQVTARVGMDVDETLLVLKEARIDTGTLRFGLDAEIERPLREASRAHVRVGLGELVLNPEIARQLAGWLPAEGRGAMLSVAERVRSGRLQRAELRGDASLARWSDVLTGALERMPAGLRFAMAFDGVVLDVDENNRLHDLEAQLHFDDDRLVVTDASGRLNDGPLPSLSLAFDGLSKVLAAPREGRTMASSASPLLGLTPLFEFLRSEPDPAAPRTRAPRVELVFEHLEHPALLWPIRDVKVQLALRPGSDGFSMEIARCAWAGVLLDGEVDWTLRPERRLDIALVASGPEGVAAPDAPAPEGATDLPSRPGEGRPWVEGRFRVGGIEAPRWSQSGASGRFSARGGALRLEDVDIRLTPAGRATGHLDLDLSQPDRVPYAALLKLDGADLSTLVAQRGARRELMSGVVDVRAELSGSLVPGRPLLHDAEGEANLAARDGAIQRGVPPVLALALASSSLNPFSSREELRYREARAPVRFEEGTLTTEGLEIDGPDIRLFASGDLDFSTRPPEVDAEVALFLFRQVDRALDLIPILNVLLLGENQNLIAAYFQLEGAWSAPEATSKPLRTLAEGPGSVLTKGVPRVMMQGVRAIGGLFTGGEDSAPVPASAAE